MGLSGHKMKTPRRQEKERSLGEGKGYPLQYSGLENSMDSPWSHKESDTTERLSLPKFLTESIFLKI